jgi:TPP-dependent pyruvate/acetoin dehydrogenase alpha subunit
MIEAGFAEPEELKETEKTIRKSVQKAVLKVKDSPRPPLDQLYKHIFATNIEGGESEFPKHIRMPNYEKSFWA